METIHLLLFSRAPVEGETKTRLASAIGPRAALEFHAHCLNDIIETCLAFARENSASETAETDRAALELISGVRPPPAPGSGDGGPPRSRANCHLFITPPGSEAAFAEAGVAIPAEFKVQPQRGDNLGARMANAFGAVLANEPAASGRALLFGSDLPLLEAGHLWAATAALVEADAVFGPASDGGYYLVGLNAPQPKLFELGRWGGGDVLRRSQANAREAGLRLAVLDPLPDVDTLDDLPRVMAHPLFGKLAQRRACRFVAAHARIAGSM